MANQFSVDVPDVTQALLGGQQAYDTARKSSIRNQAAEAYRNGDSTGALQMLLNGGDYDAIKGLQAGEAIKRSEAERAAGSEFGTGIATLLGGAPLAAGGVAQPAPSPTQRLLGYPAPSATAAPANLPAASAPIDTARQPVMPTSKVWGDKEAEDAGLYEPRTRVASAGPTAIPVTPASRSTNAGQTQAQNQPPPSAQPTAAPAPAGNYQIGPQHVPYLAKAAANPMLPAADRDLAKTLLVRALDQSKPNEKMQYLQQLKDSSGYKGTPLELELELRRAGKTDVNTVIDQKGETEEAKAAGKAAGERRATMFAAAGAASKTLQNLSRTEGLLNQVSQGKLSPAKYNISSWAKSLGLNDDVATSLGLDPKGLGSAQALQSLVNESVVGKIGAGGFPANNFSDADREFITDIFPKLSNDPRGNKIIIEGARRMARLDMQRAKDYQGWKSRPDNKGKGFEDFETYYSDKVANQDIFGDLRKEAEALVGGPRTDIGGTLNNPGPVPQQATPQSPAQGGWQDMGGGVRIRERR